MIKKKKKIKNNIDILINDPIIRIAFIIFLLILFTTISIFIIEKNVNNEIRSLFDSFWYTIVTLATVGYGDITPKTTLGRVIGLIAIFFGVFFVAVITGKIASFLVDQQLKRGKGLLKLKNLKNHFIICGWKNDFDKILYGILETNPNFDISDIVIINNIPIEDMQLFMENSEYKLINYIHGDFIDESVLLRASIKTAKRILILATDPGNHNPMEVDSRTVMTVMTINKLNKNIYVIAELFDEKFEKYLQMAHCDEIILSKQYERILIANASCGSGISHVVRDLLSVDKNERISIIEIPQSFIGISFKKAFEYFSIEKNSILIGLLENTGNFYSRKHEALTEAQKTPDISKIVQNLQKVKELKANNPVLNPGFDYLIKENSMAIIIGSVK